MPGKPDLPRPRLALAVPCYNRDAAFAVNMAAILPEAAALGVPVYISDDSSTDAIENLAREFQGRFANLIYRRNRPALRHDANVIDTILWPDADYVWLLGDSFRPRPGELARILALLGTQDFLFINNHAADCTTVPAVTGEAALAMVRDKLWHQTLTGATIYGPRVRDWMRCGFASARNFPQIAIILGFMGRGDACLGWYGPQALDAEAKQGSYWTNQAIATFVTDWGEAVAAHHSVIGEEYLASVIKSHSRNMQFFSIQTLSRLRRSGDFSWRSLNLPHFWDAMHETRLRVLLVLAANPLLRGLWKLKARARAIAGAKAG